MGIMEFQKKFGTEGQCRLHMFRARWPKGFVCPKCGGGEHFDIKSRRLFQCKACGRQTSVTAGTIMDKTRTPLAKWFMAVYLMAADKRGVSAPALARQIGVAYYTAWTMCRKIRHAMGARDGGRALGGTVEMDEAFLGAPRRGGQARAGLGEDPGAGLPVAPRGRQAQGGQDEGGGGRGPRRCEGVRRGARSGRAARFARTGCTSTGSWPGLGFAHVRKKHDPKSEPAHIHWTHIIISNAKAMVGGTFHGLGAKHLQRYLDEFCYRFNRRLSPDGIFGRLLYACLCAGRITAHELIG